MYNQSKHMANI